MNINEIQEQWEQDSIIDKNHLDDESIKTSRLHCKYISYFTEFKLKYSKIRYEYSILKRNKLKYFKGELSKEELQELGWYPYQFNKPLKSEIDGLIDQDKDVIELKLRIDYIESCIHLLESIITALKDRTWSIKNAITFKQFEAGF